MITELSPIGEIAFSFNPWPTLTDIVIEQWKAVCNQSCHYQTYDKTETYEKEGFDLKEAGCIITNPKHL